MTKKELQGMKTKKRIIDCACKLFRERGFHDVTVDDIIREANSSKGSFYTHFKSKEELLFNMAPIVDEVYLDFMNNGAAYTNTIDKILAFIQYVFKIMDEKIGLEFISAIYASQIKDLKTERFLIASERAYYRVFEKLIEEGKEKKEIRQGTDAKHIIKVFTSVIRGVIFDWCLHKGEFNLADYGGEIMNIMLNQIKPH